MGGLVVKQAYIIGQNDDQYSDIVSSISAILFLATPHRGSNLADILNRILTVSVFNHSPKLYISELSVGSQTVAALNEQFRHIAPNLDILSFYETLKTSVGPKKMVCWILSILSTC
jgi:triacylglycerol esterase/lipase EstA (alpha/beta hydrolase family)